MDLPEGKRERGSWVRENMARMVEAQLMNLCRMAVRVDPEIMTGGATQQCTLVLLQY